MKNQDDNSFLIPDDYDFDNPIPNTVLETIQYRIDRHLLGDKISYIYQIINNPESYPIYVSIDVEPGGKVVLFSFTNPEMQTSTEKTTKTTLFIDLDKKAYNDFEIIFSDIGEELYDKESGYADSFRDELYGDANKAEYDIEPAQANIAKRILIDYMGQEFFSKLEKNMITKNNINKNKIKNKTGKQKL